MITVIHHLLFEESKKNEICNKIKITCTHYYNMHFVKTQKDNP